MRAEDEPTFHEIAAEGPIERSHGLLLGVLLGSGVTGQLYFADEEGIAGSLGERLLAAVGLHAPICHAVADTALRDLFRRFAEPLALHGLRVAQVRAVRDARFKFGFRAYTPKHTADFRALIAGLPKGIELDVGETRERLDPDAAGVEAYTAAHAYESAAEGAISGRVDLVIAARRHLSTQQLVQPGHIELDLGDEE
jgi:hypothetical protein